MFVIGLIMGASLTILFELLLEIRKDRKNAKQ